MTELRPSDVTNLAGQDTGRAHLSHSALSTFLNCGRKFQFEKLRRLEPIARRPALSLGSAFQKGVELRDPYAGSKDLERETTSQEDEDRLIIEQATVKTAVALYLRTYGEPEREVREFEYRVRLRSPWSGYPSQTFDLLGYADGVIDAGSHLELIENKFTGQIDGVAIRRLPLDRQVALACYGLWRATGKEVRVVHYRFTRKPSIKPKKATAKTPAETVGQFCARLEADYADPERAEFYTREETLFRSTDDLLQIEAELWDWAEQLRNARDRDFYSRNTSHCHDFGGCAFIPLCVGDPDAETLYQQRAERTQEEIPA